ncbi:hypothetical protein [Arcicella rosea]|uniref:Transglutaminase-like superfamily protein n=1 Tax=Arcicella rosea TaxID=502909 RepID=A0A841EI09_9BACT|nr:hypothetical protein [Arcicella rosea]MBB6003837.1 hypothetical protein [Arcicella rosea]
MDNYFKKPTKTDYIKKPVAIHTEDTFYNICKKYIPASLKQTKSLSEYFKNQKNSYLTSKKIFGFVKTYITYRIDQKGFEEIRFPNQLWKDKVGDCEDFTIFCSSILCNLRISHTIRMADYGKGWQHIYIKVGNTVLDPVQDMFNYEDKGKYLDYEINANGLGKLPVSLYSAREKFILELWNAFQKDGVVYKKDIETNTIPTDNVESLVDYLKDKLGVKAIYLPQEEKQVTTAGKTNTVKFTERIRVELQNTTITFDPETISRLVAKIAGNEALKPLKKVNTQAGIHPDNTELMSIFKDFVSKYDGIRSKAFSTINFSENGVASTNLYSILHLKTETNVIGNYYPSGEALEEDLPFPDYFRILEKNSDHSITITTNLSELEKLIQTAHKFSDYGDKSSKPIILRSTLNSYEFEATSEKITEVKGKVIVDDFSARLISKTSFDSFFVIIESNIIVKLLRVLNKLKVSNIKISVSANRDEIRPILIKCDTKFGELTYLLQPLSRIDNSKKSIIKRENNFRKILIPYRYELQAI